MVEAGLAILSLGIAMTLTLKVASWIGHENREGDRRQRAILEVSNLMERLSALPFDQLDQKTVASLTLSPATARALPNSKLAISLAQDDPVGGSGSKRIDVMLRWRDTADAWTGPVTLSSWIHASGSDQK